MIWDILRRPCQHIPSTYPIPNHLPQHAPISSPPSLRDYFQFPSNLQKSVQLYLTHLNLTLVNVIQNKLEALGINITEINQGVGMDVLPEY